MLLPKVRPEEVFDEVLVGHVGDEREDERDTLRLDSGDQEEENDDAFLDTEAIVEEEPLYLDDGTSFHEECQDPPPNMPVVEKAVAKSQDPPPSILVIQNAIETHTDQDRLDNTIPQAAADYQEVPEKKKAIDWKFVTTLILGDLFHNFADGIFLGNAFLLCSRDVVYAIVAATIYHELAQELADYCLLTTHCGLKPLYALTLNFIDGLAIVLGVVVIFSMPIDEATTGVLLCISAGVYINVAASECLPRVDQVLENLCDRLSSMLFFVMGTVPIGLVLLTHGHCEAE